MTNVSSKGRSGCKSDGDGFERYKKNDTMNKASGIQQQRIKATKHSDPISIPTISNHDKDDEDDECGDGGDGGDGGGDGGGEGDGGGGKIRSE